MPEKAGATNNDGREWSGARTLLIVSADDSLEELLRSTGELEGIAIERTPTSREAMQIIQHDPPAALITDVKLEDGSGYDLIEALRSSPAGDAALAIVVSGTSEFIDKVDAMRCGADAFFERPLDVAAVVRRIRQLSEPREMATRTIFALQAHPDTDRETMHELETAGYRVHVSGDPRQFEAELSNIQPDLILLDVELPGMSGYDVSRWIRQHEAWTTLPIVFVADEAPVTTRIESVRAGGDDHLTRPLLPALLVSTVAARIERARFLRSLLERDGLTGLLNHSAFMERLKSRLAQARRSALVSAALAMIDLDRFKAINDLHGHLTGDRVLVSLAGLLRRRLRQSDTIGRYGGEEFAVLIEDLNAAEAERLMQRLREEFRSTEHESSDGVRFTVTFSAGIAVLDRKIRTLEEWIERADQALYQAKEQGRDRIVVDA